METTGQDPCRGGSSTTTEPGTRKPVGRVAVLIGLLFAAGMTIRGRMPVPTPRPMIRHRTARRHSRGDRPAQCVDARSGRRHAHPPAGPPARRRWNSRLAAWPGRPVEPASRAHRAGAADRVAARGDRSQPARHGISAPRPAGVPQTVRTLAARRRRPDRRRGAPVKPGDTARILMAATAVLVVMTVIAPRRGGRAPPAQARPPRPQTPQPRRLRLMSRWRWRPNAASPK